MDNVRSGTTIRQPSTANLLIDSYDRATPSASDFTISVPGNILSGYFTRLAVVEMVLDYSIPNISVANNNNKFSVRITSTGIISTVTIPSGNYTVSALMATLITLLNTATSQTFTFVGRDGAKALTCGVAFSVPYSNLSAELSLSILVETASALAFPILQPEIIGKNNFLDFVCTNLTYQQGLKDSSTSMSPRDVLYRWVLSWEDYSERDADGYPIYQGYLPFKSRRYLSYPKQIKWDSQQPIGQLKFEVYDSGYFDYSTGQRVQPQIVVPTGGAGSTGGLEWYMTLLVSEQ